jgi:hypothetical protein
MPYLRGERTPPCGATDLKAKASFYNGAGMSLIGAIHLRNGSGQRCALPKTPRVPDLETFMTFSDDPGASRGSAEARDSAPLGAEPQPVAGASRNGISSRSIELRSGSERKWLSRKQKLHSSCASAAGAWSSSRSSRTNRRHRRSFRAEGA